MRNKFVGPCYRCNLPVEPGTGYFEKVPRGGWRVQHCYHTNKGGELQKRGITCEMAPRKVTPKPEPPHA